MATLRLEIFPTELIKDENRKYIDQREHGIEELLLKVDIAPQVPWNITIFAIEVPRTITFERDLQSREISKKI